MNPASRLSALPMLGRLDRIARVLGDIGAVHAVLPRAFLILAAPMVVFFALAVPPMQTPDEPAHLFRADQIAHGEFVGTRRDDDASGGSVDPGFVRLAVLFFPMISDPARTMTLEDFHAARSIALSGEPVFVSFVNTVQYGPLLYLPPAAALWLAHGVGLDALPAFHLARLFNAAAAVAAGFLALRLAGRGRFVLFVLLSTPMTLFLFASVSQDALMIAGAALFVGLASRIVGEERPPGAGEALALVVLLTALAWGRLPNLMLGAVFLLPAFGALRWRGRTLRIWPRAAMMGAAIGLAALWGVHLDSVRVDLLPGVSADRQIAALLADPAAIPRIAFWTFANHGTAYMAHVIGVLGWLEIVLPKTFYALALLGFLAALAADATRPWPVGAVGRGAVAFGLLAGFGGVFLGLYLTWTPVGGPLVEGVQGRYLTPFLMGAGLVLPFLHAGAAAPARWIAAPAMAILLLVPAAGAALSVTAVLRHFY